MTVPVLERHPGVPQNTVRYAICLGFFQRLKALEKIHSTRNFKAPSQWRWKRKHLKEYDSHQTANKRRQMCSLVITDSGQRLWRIRKGYIKKNELVNWVSDSSHYFIFCIHMQKCCYLSYLFLVKGKGKAVPLQAWTGPEGSRKLRLPDFVTTAQGGGRLSALRTGGFTPRKYSWYSFLLEVESTPGP